MEKFKLKKGDRVWLKIPTNATIIRVNKKYGYTIKTDEDGGTEICYFGDSDVEKLHSK